MQSPAWEPRNVFIWESHSVRFGNQAMFSLTQGTVIQSVIEMKIENSTMLGQNGDHSSATRPHPTQKCSGAMLWSGTAQCLV